MLLLDLSPRRVVILATLCSLEGTVPISEEKIERSAVPKKFIGGFRDNEGVRE